MNIKKINLGMMKSNSLYPVEMVTAVFHYEPNNGQASQRTMLGSPGRVKEYIEEEMTIHPDSRPSLVIDPPIDKDKAKEFREHFSNLCRRGASA